MGTPDLYYNSRFFFVFSAVTTIEDRLSVDVKVDLCYCDKDECNADQPSHSDQLVASKSGPYLLLAIVYIHSLSCKG